MAFRIKAVTLPAEASGYKPLQFTAQLCDERGRVSRQVDPVLDSKLGARVEYGNLFAYLFHRFGYPSGRWRSDAFVRYVLATPLAYMYLLIQPTIDGLSSQVFSFIAPVTVRWAAETFSRKARDALMATGSSGWVRPAQLRAWDTGDPLSPYARGASRTLAALQRPVCVGIDGTIDMFGPIARPRRAARPQTPV